MSPLLSGLASVASLVFNAASGSPARAGGARRGAEAGEPAPSTVVTLSPQAEALAGFAGKGMLVAQDRASGALSSVAGGARQAGGGGASVSVSEFEDILARMGADEAEKKQITAGFDANRDGRVSRDEFLKAMADTAAQKPGSELSQALLHLMDRGGDGNGIVNSTEFAQFSTAFANAAARRSAVA